MLLERPARGAPPGGFVLYVEGPRDRDLLRAWAHRTSPRLGRGVARTAVILGGRQPARAIAHFRDLWESKAATQGFCVLDRDDATGAEHGAGAHPGLEFFTWSRRHIESYLLVPAAIQRGLGLTPDDPRVQRFFRERLPAADDEEALREVDAKRLLARNGEFENVLGRSLAPGRIARAMRPEELHGDIRFILGRLTEGMGLAEPETLVRVRGVRGFS